MLPGLDADTPHFPWFMSAVVGERFCVYVAALGKDIRFWRPFFFFFLLLLLGQLGNAKVVKIATFTAWFFV